MARVLTALVIFILLSVGHCRRHVEILADDFSLQQPPVTVTAFNVRVLGQRKLTKAHVMDVVMKVISQSDIALIQEIRDVTEKTAKTIHALVNSTSHPFEFVASSRLGRTQSKEQYAIYYRRDRFELLDTYQYPDPHDVFERPPFLARFKALTINSLSNFGFLAFHASPSDAVNETSHLVDVYDDIQRQYGSLENVLIAGDLNADCNYVDGNDWPRVKLRNDPRFTWLTSDVVDTTVTSTDCTYDRFIAAGSNLQLAYIPDSSGVIRFDRIFNLNETASMEVSDHYPIVLQLAGTANNSLQRSLVTSTEYSVGSKLPVSNIASIRAIYRKPKGGFEVEVLQRNSGGMLYVIATKRNLLLENILSSLKLFSHYYPDVLDKLTTDGVRAYVWAEVMKPSHVYGLNIQDTGLYNLEIHCRLKDPLICKVTVALQTSA